MTEKSLSEKICEECGIKKKRVELYNCKGCKYLINNECERGDNPCKPPYKYVYPDFEKNNDNFVKLYELKIIDNISLAELLFKWNKLYELKIIDNISLAELLFKWNIANYSRETFLNNLFYITKPDSNIENNTKEIIKQAIREAKWEV